MCDAVVALPERRARIAGDAVQVAMERGAHTVLASYDTPAEDVNRPWLAIRKPRTLWAYRERNAPRQMALGPTYDDTLARFGKSTRFNFRYYRKRLQAKMECEYVADAREVLGEDQMLDLNASALEPIDPRMCLSKLASAREQGSFLAGLRTADGTWLSAVGGWRSGDTVIFLWQANRAGYEKDSLVTVMRAFFLEDETRRGSTRLMFYDGTSHSMHHSFQPEPASDFVVRRRSLRGSLIRAIASLVATPEGVTGRANFAAALLCEPDLSWHPADVVRSSPAFPGQPSAGEIS